MRRPTSSPLRHLVVLATVLPLVACAAADSQPPSDGSAAPPAGAGQAVLVIADGGIGTEPALSVGEALGHRATDDLVTVSGALFVEPDGTVRLCEALAESFPPQCGGASIVVQGLDPQTVAGLQTEGDVSWADDVTLFGSVE